MPEYKLTGRMRKVVDLSSRFQARDPDALTDDLINNINNMTIARRDARKILCDSAGISTST